MPGDIFKLNSGNYKQVANVTSREPNVTGKICITILFVQKNNNPSIILIEIVLQYKFSIF